MANGWSILIGLVVVLLACAAGWFLSPKGETQTIWRSSLILSFASCYIMWANIAAVPYPQSNKIFNASTLFATTAHPRDLAAAGTSYSQMTIRIGNNFVEEETSSAVLTEFGRGYRGIKPKRTSGEKGEDVRKRIERWKASVERAHRIRKKTYWNTMGCCAKRRKLLSLGELAELEVCFSMRAQMQAEIAQLRQQREHDRARVQSALDAQNNRIKVLQENFNETPQVQAQSEQPCASAFDDEPSNSSVKSEVSDSESEEDRSETSDIYDVQDKDYHPTPKTTTLRKTQPSLAELTRKTFTLYEGMRMPSVIERLAPLRNVRLPDQPNEAFSFKFLKKVFGGTAMTKTCYVIPPKSRQGRLFPDDPRQHGAQLSCIYGDDDIQITTFPVFIHRTGEGYRYFGHYREPRDSDLVSGSEMIQVPPHVKQYWADQLGRKNSDRTKSRKILDALIGQWPQTALGWFRKGNNTIIEYQPGLVQKYGEAVMRPITDEEAEEIEESSILEYFERADFDKKGTISLWYEYLECVAYDKDFYHKLVSKKHELEPPQQA
ncbi:hypothetical protein EG329_001137 [Mollisiaceae sp. DMI_Dod_QoI]|nr:hypothetical protein EG329_001137 [Helotiales sp. DMI_Dod_QoI]